MPHFFLISFLLIPVFQFFHNVIQIDTGIFPHDEKMIEQIAGFINDFFLILMLVGSCSSLPFEGNWYKTFPADESDGL